MNAMNSNNAKARRALLAKIHIAKKELGLDDDLYRFILDEEFGVQSAKTLSNTKLERLVSRFEGKGWKAQNRSQKPGARSQEYQAEALKERIGQEILHSNLTTQRFRGLVRSICGMDSLEWCGDAVRLKKLLAVLTAIINREESGVRRQESE